MRRFLINTFGFIAVFFLVPIAAHGAWWTSQGWPDSWRAADWASADILPGAVQQPTASTHIMCARTGRWKGALGEHCWIVLKDAGAAAYDRYDVVGWRRPVRRNAYPPDGRWYSNTPRIIFSCAGPAAARINPQVRAAVAGYPHVLPGTYRLWPGPNSNTFVAAVMRAVPQINAGLPPVAVGKDFVVDGSWIAPTPSNTGWQISAAGYGGAALAWKEGLELHFLGQTLGVSPATASIKLPGIGRITAGEAAPARCD